MAILNPFQKRTSRVASLILLCLSVGCLDEGMMTDTVSVSGACEKSSGGVVESCATYQGLLPSYSSGSASSICLSVLTTLTVVSSCPQVGCLGQCNYSEESNLFRKYYYIDSPAGSSQTDCSRKSGQYFQSCSF